MSQATDTGGDQDAGVCAACGGDGTKLVTQRRGLVASPAGGPANLVRKRELCSRSVVPDANHRRVNDVRDVMPRMRESASNADEDLPMARAPQFPVPRSNEQKWLIVARDWPLRSYLELGALPSAVPCARAHAGRLLWEWGLTGLSDSVELVVSELMTNALRASESMEPQWIFPIKLWLLSDEAHALIMVWDANSGQPVRKSVSDDSVGGRGLAVVEAFSQRWGWYFVPETGGKVVWCLVSAVS